MKKNKNLIVISITVLLMILAVAGATYAYFTATITDGDNGSSVIIQTAHLSLLYSDSEYINQSGILPGDTYSKTVTVTNQGNIPVYYDLLWYELVNELATRDDFVISITCGSSTDTCTGLSETTVEETGTYLPLLYNVEIGALEVHTYVITLLFKETGSNQNDNQGKNINGKIGIVESGTFLTDLYGYVYDENGDPLSGTLIELHSDPVSVLTDSAGKYEFSSVPLGDHTVYVKTADKTSTIMTTPISVKYGTSKGVTGTSAAVVNTSTPETPVVTSIGINITKTATTPTLALTPTASLKGSNGSSSYSGEYYSYKSSITSVDFQNTINVSGSAIASWDVSSDGSSTIMAYVISDGSSGHKLYIQSESLIYAPINSSYLFYGFSDLVSINGMQYFDTSKVTSMKSMFYLCYDLTTMDVSGFNTSKVTDMGAMFSNCQDLATINLGSFNTSNVIDMHGMFYGCGVLTSLNLSSFNTSKVTTMDGMFNQCELLTNLNLSSFNTSNVTDMGEMFLYCSELTTLNLSSFDFSSVTWSGDMFVAITSGIAIQVKDTAGQTFINLALSECGKSGTVTIG